MPGSEAFSSQFYKLGLFTPYLFLSIALSGMALSGARVFSKYLKRYKDSRSSAEEIGLGVLFICAIAYLFFWSYFLSPTTGKTLSWLMLPVAGVSGYFAFFQKKNPISKETRFILSFVFWVGILYLSALVLYPSALSLSFQPAIHFFQNRMPTDNEIPLGFADRLLHGQDPRDVGATWLSSDRPPLQAGLTLIFFPVLFPAFPMGDYYEAIGLLAQLIWIFSFWQLFQVLKLPIGAFRISILLSVFSGFFFMNSLFTWPKFLAGGLFIISVFFLQRWKETGSRIYSILCGSALVFSALAHSGVVFSLPIFFGILILSEGKYYKGATWPKRLSTFYPAAVVFVLLWTPWFLYQKLYNPPGDRLIKMHLGGVSEVDLRSTWEVIKTAYQALGWQGALHNKIENIKFMFGGFYPSFDTDLQRHSEFFYLARALGIFHLGWLGLFLNRQNSHKLFYFLAWSAVSLVFWAVLMFSANATSIHQGSYATMIVLFFTLGVAIFRIPKGVVNLLIFVQVLYFMWTWVLNTSQNDFNPAKINYCMLLLIAVSTYKVLKATNTITELRGIK